MRFVQRGPRPATWGVKADKWTKKSLTEGSAHKANSKIYGDSELVRALLELFAFKCAYCEYCAHRPPDVEHFRPKAAVAENDKHPGYYWLAYEWSNLYPACSGCNQRRTDPFEAHRGGQGKATKFPLLDENTRVTDPKGDLAAEARALLDPCLDRPEEHLQLEADGSVSPRNGSKMGEASRDVFNLDSFLLNRLRLKCIEDLERHHGQGRIDEVARMLSDASPFCGLLREFHKELLARIGPQPLDLGPAP